MRVEDVQQRGELACALPRQAAVIPFDSWRFTCGCGWTRPRTSAPSRRRATSNARRCSPVCVASGAAFRSPSAPTRLSVAGAYIYFIYMPTYLQTQLHVPAGRALISNIVGIGVLLVLIPFVGRLTDRVGRRPVLLAGSIGILVLSYPFFLAFASGDYALIVLAQALACGILALAIVPQVALIAELFPTSVRLSSFALASALGVVLFGGTAPLIATYLVAATGSLVAPAFFVMLTALFSTAAAWVTDDPFRQPLREW